MGTITTLLKIQADASQAVRGLKPLQASLEETAKDAQVTEKALNGLDGTHKIVVQDQAIENARKEVERLRNLMRDQLRLDINADTRESQRRIKQLQSSIRTLDQQTAVVDVVVDTHGTGQLTNALGQVEDQLGNVVPGLGALSGGMRAAGVAAAPLAGAAVTIGAGFAAWNLGEMAADVETVTLQLSALTGSAEDGAKAFEMLQRFAKQTPFELDEVTASARSLLIAGVELQDIPGWLEDIGAAAAVSGQPISEISLIFQQMLTKGKASNEELLQLAERGIPAYQILADSMGVTVAEVQDLASKSKLGADSIKLISDELGEMFPTAMLDQADSFNGKMSTLNDTVRQAGATLGMEFLPAMKGTVDALQDAADIALYLAENLGGVKDFLKNMIPFADQIGFALGHSGDALDKLADLTRTEEEKLADAGKAGKKAGEDIEDGADQGAAALKVAGDEAKEFQERMEELEEAVKSAIAAFAGIGGNKRLRVDFIISKDDLEEDIRTAIQGVDVKGIEKDVPPIELPANLNLGQIGDLGDQQQELVSSISSFVQMGLEEGSRRAEIVPGFDEDAWYRQVRKDTRGLLIEAGIDPSEVQRVLENIFGLPRTVPVGADVSDAKKAIADLKPPPLTIPLNPTMRPDDLDPVARSMLLPGDLAPTVAPIVATPEGTDAAAVTLDGVANPPSGPRIAIISPMIDPGDLLVARNILAELTKTQTKLIKIHMEENPTGDTLTPGMVRQMMSTGSPVTITGTSSTTQQTGAERTRLAPRQTPVAVYLDGHVIADRLEARRDLAAITSVRRTA